MGHRRNRKRDRRNGDRWLDQAAVHTAEPPATLDEDDILLLMQFRSAQRGAPAALACGTCQEFIEDANAGRGTCIHPASGVLSPWPDTAACPFHLRRRNR